MGRERGVLVGGIIMSDDDDDVVRTVGSTYYLLQCVKIRARLLMMYVCRIKSLLVDGPFIAISSVTRSSRRATCVTTHGCRMCVCLWRQR